MGNAKQTSVSLTKNEKIKVQELADRLGISFSAALRIMINDFSKERDAILRPNQKSGK